MGFNLFGGLFGLILFVLDVWAIAQILTSDAPGGKKAIWVIAVAVLPFLGLVAWYFFGPKPGDAARG